jgi:hypothetical protein
MGTGRPVWIQWQPFIIATLGGDLAATKTRCPLLVGRSARSEIVKNRALPRGRIVPLVNGATGPVLLGGTASAPCQADSINGPINLTANTAGVTLAGTTVSGAVALTGNMGGTLAAGNTIDGPLACSGTTRPQPMADSPTPSRTRPAASAPHWPDQ